MPKFHPQSSSLSTILGALRAQGKTIVLANGCFDLLHVGHVRFLVDAKSRGDYLVVAVNSDESVRENKGEDRPIVPEAERAEVLAALECVDYVTVFGETTADEILRRLKPTLHAKGTDYDAAHVPEADTLKTLGISTVICGDPKDHSTRDLLARLRTQPAVSAGPTSGTSREVPPKAGAAGRPAAPPTPASPAAKSGAKSSAKRVPAKDVKPQPKAKPVAGAKSAPTAKTAPRPVVKSAPKTKAASAGKRSSDKG